VSIACPNCGSLLNHRSNKKGLVERLFLSAIFVQPFRCEDCDCRFFRWSLAEKLGPAHPKRTS